MECIGKLYNYYFVDCGSSIIDAPNALEEVRASLSPEKKAQLEGLTIQAFQKRLVSLVLLQEEDQAIQYVLQVAVVLEDKPLVIKKEFFDFSRALPDNNLAKGRSISHVSNLLNLKRLNVIIDYLSNNYSHH